MVVDRLTKMVNPHLMHLILLDTPPLFVLLFLMKNADVSSLS